MDATRSELQNLARTAWLAAPIPVVIFTFDPRSERPALRVEDANPAAMELFAGQEIAGRELAQLFPHADSHAAIEAVRSAVQAGRQHATEVVHGAGKSARWIELTFSSSTIMDAEARPGGRAAVVVTAVDITERRALEVDLRESDVNMRLATSSGGVGTWLLDLETGQLSVDSVSARLASLCPTELRTVDDLLRVVHEEDRGYFDMEQLIDRVGIRARLMDGDKLVRTVLIRGRLFGTETSKRLAGTIIDISATHDLSNRLAETLESISDAYFAIDNSWNITYANRRAEMFVNRSSHDLVGSSLWSVLTEPHARVASDLRHAMETRSPVVVETTDAARGAWYEVRAFPLQSGLSIYFSDITDRKSVEQQRDRLLTSAREARFRAEEARKQIAFQARHDVLTGLVNRTELARSLDEHLTKNGGSRAAVMFVDIDHFKWVNDSLGHAFGDHLLIELAERFVPLVREGDLVSRFGGDEFVVVLFDTDTESAEEVAHRLADAARQAVEFDGRSIHITVSIGLARQIAESSAESLIRDADIALYRAKELGRNQISWFHEDARDELAERARIQTELRAGLERGEVILHYQPSWNLKSGKIVDLEALARWEHPELGLLGANEFVPSVDRTSLIVDLGDYVMRQAVAEAAKLRDIPDLTVWINVSPRQLIGPGLARTLLETLAEHDLPTARIGIEVIETTLVDASSAETELQALHDAGVRIAIDDYGTGYSSLARLQRLPLDMLKIDRSIVSDVSTEKGRALVESIIQLATALGATTVAEGIERQEQLEVVRRLGCTSASGYFLANSMSLQQVREYLNAPGGNGIET